MCSFETSGISYPVTRRHVPEDLNIQQHRCENLKSSKGKVNCYNNSVQFSSCLLKWRVSSQVANCRNGTTEYKHKQLRSTNRAQHATHTYSTTCNTHIQHNMQHTHTAQHATHTYSTTCNTHIQHNVQHTHTAQTTENFSNYLARLILLN